MKTIAQNIQNFAFASNLLLLLLILHLGSSFYDIKVVILWTYILTYSKHPILHKKIMGSFAQYLLTVF